MEPDSLKNGSILSKGSPSHSCSRKYKNPFSVIFCHSWVWGFRVFERGAPPVCEHSLQTFPVRHCEHLQSRGRHHIPSIRFWFLLGIIFFLLGLGLLLIGTINVCMIKYMYVCMIQYICVCMCMIKYMYVCVWLNTFLCVYDWIHLCVWWV